jgi:acetoin utilization deacetylase AcuC-like enzyme
VVPAFEAPARAEDILDAVRPRHDVREPGEHGLGPLAAVHDRDYLRHLETAWADWLAEGGSGPLVADTFPLRSADPAVAAGGAPPSAEARAGWWCFDASTPILEGTYPAVRAAADCALTAVEGVLQGAPAAYALCRPPGHHAGRDFAGGYCYVNHAAVTAARLRAHGGRVAVLDLDYHHGNGTQQIFWHDAEVLYASLHADPDTEYPYYTGRAAETGGPGAEGATLNLPLPFGTGDEAYLEVARAACERVAGWAPEAIVVSLGLDGFEGDPMGRFSLTVDAYRELGATVRGLGVPVVVVQEGGYALGSLGSLVAAFLGGLEAGSTTSA